MKQKVNSMSDYIEIVGGSFYRFENGYGYYGFDIPANTSLFVTDPESGLVYMHVDDEALCRWIYMIEPDSLINGKADTLTIEELSNVDGLDYIGTDPDGIATAKAYCSMFHYLAILIIVTRTSIQHLLLKLLVVRMAIIQELTSLTIQQLLTSHTT